MRKQRIVYAQEIIERDVIAFAVGGTRWEEPSRMHPHGIPKTMQLNRKETAKVVEMVRLN